MSDPSVKKFKVAVRDANGALVKEAPRLMISIDGEEKSLVIGDNTVIASCAYDQPDSVLWTLARKKLGLDS